jgi:hypothetical protein
LFLIPFPQVKNCVAYAQCYFCELLTNLADGIAINRLPYITSTFEEYCGQTYVLKALVKVLTSLETKHFRIRLALILAVATMLFMCDVNRKVWSIVTPRTCALVNKFN